MQTWRNELKLKIRHFRNDCINKKKTIINMCKKIFLSQNFLKRSYKFFMSFLRKFEYNFFYKIHNFWLKSFEKKTKEINSLPCLKLLKIFSRLFAKLIKALVRFKIKKKELDLLQGCYYFWKLSREVVWPEADVPSHKDAQ